MPAKKHCIVYTQKKNILCVIYDEFICGIVSARRVRRICILLLGWGNIFNFSFISAIATQLSAYWIIEATMMPSVFVHCILFLYSLEKPMMTHCAAHFGPKLSTIWGLQVSSMNYNSVYYWNPAETRVSAD